MRTRAATAVPTRLTGYALAQTIAIGENNDGDWVCEPYNSPIWTQPGWCYPQHNNGTDFTFMDGHAAWVGFNQAHSNVFWLFLTDKP